LILRVQIRARKDLLDEGCSMMAAMIFSSPPQFEQRSDARLPGGPGAPGRHLRRLG
jgi:hypothetical protein